MSQSLWSEYARTVLSSNNGNYLLKSNGTVHKLLNMCVTSYFGHFFLFQSYVTDRIAEFCVWEFGDMPVQICYLPRITAVIFFDTIQSLYFIWIIIICLMI